MTNRPEWNHSRRITESAARRLLAAPPEGDFIAALRQVLKNGGRAGWFTINQAAELADMSVRTLQRKLATEGWAFSDLLGEVRAERAVELLENTDISLTEAAHELGYSTLPNFSRAFQRWTGKTPAEFRRG